MLNITLETLFSVDLCIINFVLIYISYFPLSSLLHTLSILAQGTLKSSAAGIVAGLASQANSLKMGTGDDDKPTVVVEFDTG